MRLARLEYALESGLFELPADGMIAVYRPREGDELQCLPKARLQVVTGFKPDADWFTARGYGLGDGKGAAAAVVCLPRARDAARALVAQAMIDSLADAPIVIDGQKTDGIDTMLKDCRAAGLEVSGPLSKSHGKVFTLRAGPAPAGWAAVAQQIEGGFQTWPGIFSADAADRGSKLLADVLPEKLGSRVIDLGAGWGYLSRHILGKINLAELDVVEAEADALACAKINLQDDPRVRLHWADARSFKPARPAHSVVMNPPFHTARDADPALGVSFLRAAASMLVPDGTLWLVANRHLPYAPALSTLFRQVEEIGGDSAFRLTRASHPIRQR